MFFTNLFSVLWVKTTIVAVKGLTLVSDIDEHFMWKCI